MATPDNKDKVNEKKFYITDAGTEITVYKGVGSDTATTRFLNMSSEPFQLIILPTADIAITEWDGLVLDNPMKLAANKGLTIRKMYPTFSFFKIYTFVANTSIRNIVWGSG